MSSERGSIRRRVRVLWRDYVFEGEEIHVKSELAMLLCIIAGANLGYGVATTDGFPVFTAIISGLIAVLAVKTHPGAEQIASSYIEEIGDPTEG